MAIAEYVKESTNPKIDKIRSAISKSSGVERKSIGIVSFFPATLFFLICFFISFIERFPNFLHGNFIHELGRTLFVSINLWFAGHLIPVVINDVSIGFLPLWPAILIIVFVANLTKKTCNRQDVLGDPKFVVPCVVAGPICFGVVLEVLAKLISNGLPVQLPNIFHLIINIGFVYILGAFLGVVLSNRMSTALFPEKVQKLWSIGWVKTSIFLSYKTLIGIMIISAAIVGIRAVFSFPQIFSINGSGISGWILSISYIPNAVLTVAAFIVGVPVSLGSGVLAIFTSTKDPHIAMIPIFGLVPSSHAYGWWIGFAVFALVVGVFVGYMLYKNLENKSLGTLLLSCLTTSGVCALFICVLELGSYGSIGLLGVSGANPFITGIHWFILLFLSSSLSSLIWSSVKDSAIFISPVLVDKKLIIKDKLNIAKKQKVKDIYSYDVSDDTNSFVTEQYDDYPHLKDNEEIEPESELESEIDLEENHFDEEQEFEKNTSQKQKIHRKMFSFMYQNNHSSSKAKHERVEPYHSDERVKEDYDIIDNRAVMDEPVTEKFEVSPKFTDYEVEKPHGFAARYRS